MQPLPILSTFEEMIVKISLKGVAKMQNGRYKKRHYGAKDICQRGDGKFFTTQTAKKLFPRDFPKPKSKKKTSTKETTAQNVKKKHSYKVDKSTIRSRIQTFWLTQPGHKQLYFWTVTFPKGTSEEEGHRLFNIWLTRCRSELNLKSYLWVKERQQNGTIHFHIAINQRMDVKRANRYMRASIMSSIDDGSITWSRTAAKNYNGVDIAKDKKTKRVVNFAQQKKARALYNYLSKYVTKNNETFSMLAWHCSRDYSQLITAFALTRGELIEWGIFKEVNRENSFCTEWIEFFFWSKSPPKKVTNYLQIINRQLKSQVS